MPTLVLVAAFARAAGAQAADPHAALPERPSVATHAATVAPGWLEVEGGIERPRDDGRFGDTTVPLALKVGLASQAQLTVAPSLARPAGGSVALEAMNAGVKYRLTDHAPVFGAVAVLPSVTMPAGSARDMDEDAVGLLLISSRTLGAVSVDLNAGYTRRRGDGSRAPRHESLWAASAGGPLSGRVSWMGEVSGSPRTSGPAGRARVVNSVVGVNAAVTPFLVLDVAAFVPLAGDDAFTVMSGAVWNVGRLWRKTSAGQRAEGQGHR